MHRISQCGSNETSYSQGVMCNAFLETAIKEIFTCLRAAVDIKRKHEEVKEKFSV